MTAQTEHVSWSLDKRAIEIARRRAQKMSADAGTEISISKAASSIIIEYEHMTAPSPATPRGVTRSAPKPGKTDPSYEKQEE